MTIAETMIEIKHHQDQINKAKALFVENSVITNSIAVEKKPAPILQRVLGLIAAKAKLEADLQYSNATVKIENGMTLLQAINRRKYLKELTETTEAMLTSMKSLKTSRSYSSTEKEFKTYAIDPEVVKEPLDSAAKELRILEAQIQKCNYTQDLITA